MQYNNPEAEDQEEEERDESNIQNFESELRLASR